MSTAASCRSHANEPTAAAVYGPTPGQRRQIGRPAGLGDDRRRPLQRQRAAVVAEPAPQRQHVARRRVRQRVHRREARQPALVVRHHAQRLRLLEHHLAHEQRVRVARRAPRQGPAHPLVPRQQRLDVHALTVPQLSLAFDCDRFVGFGASKLAGRREKLIPRVLVGAALVAALTAAARGRRAARPSADSPRTAKPPRSASVTPGPRSAGSSAATAAGARSPPTRSWSARATETVWDSGEVHSTASANVPYGGPALESGTEYAWRVRVWDETNTPSAYSAPATLETGLLEQSDWTAKWIAAPADDLNLSGARWIWFTGDDAANNLPAMTRYLRATVTSPPSPPRRRAAVHRRRRGDRLRQRHPGDRHQGHPRRRRERVAEGPAPRRGRPSQGRRQHDRRAGQEPPEPQRRADAGRLHRPPEGRDDDARHQQRLEVEHDRPRRLAAARLRRLRLDARARARDLRQRPVGLERQPPAAAQPVPAQGLHDRQADRAGAPVRDRARPLRGRASTAARSARTCSRPAGRSTPSASRARPTTSPASSRAATTRSARSSARAGTPAACRAGASGARTRRCARSSSITYTDGTSTRIDHRRQLAGRPRRRAAPAASTTARPTTPASTSPAGTAPASPRLAERDRAHRDDGRRARAGAADPRPLAR